MTATDVLLAKLTSLHLEVLDLRSLIRKELADVRYELAKRNEEDLTLRIERRLAASRGPKP